MKTPPIPLQNNMSTNLINYLNVLAYVFSFLLFPSEVAFAGKQEGELLWQDRFDGSFSSVAVAGKRVFVAGAARLEPGGEYSAFSVRAHDANTGELLWQNQYVGPAESGGSARAVVVQGKRVFAAGSVNIEPDPEEYSAFTVRAYHAKTGELLWQDEYTGPGGDGHASAIAVKGKHLFVAGSVGDEDLSDFLVRTYDTGTGELLWQDQVNGTDNTIDDVDYAIAISVLRNRVFVAGVIVNVDRGDDFAVRAYDVKTGELLWEDQFNGTADEYDSARDITAQGNRVYVAGRVVNEDTGQDFTVRTYSAKTGALLWQSQFDGTEPGISDGDEARAIAVQGNRVFVGGTVIDEHTGGSFTVRTYDTKRGRLLWQDQLSGGGSVWAVTVQGRRVYVAGTTSSQAGGRDFTVRSYDTKRGRLLWQDRFEGGDIARAIVVRGSTLYVTGTAAMGGLGTESIFRAYRTR